MERSLYDAKGRLYDLANQVLRRIDPEGLTTHYQYNARGQLSSVAQDGLTASYQYNSKIRFKTVHFSPKILFNLVHVPRLLLPGFKWWGPGPVSGPWGGFGDRSRRTGCRASSP